MNNLYISEVIATRLSHDLIGNIGAVANAVELLNEGDESDKEDITNILNFSSSVLSRRLKFFRLCFGLSTATVKTVEELEQITADYLLTLGNPNLPIGFEMHIETPKIHKVIMPAVMMMADVLIKGGKIVVNQNDKGIHVEALSDAPLNEKKLRNIELALKGQEVEENPSAYAPLYYLMQYLEEGAVPIKINNHTLIIGE
jgi:hypothetical protein